MEEPHSSFKNAIVGEMVLKNNVHDLQSPSKKGMCYPKQCNVGYMENHQPSSHEPLWPWDHLELWTAISALGDGEDPPEKVAGARNKKVRAETVSENDGKYCVYIYISVYVYKYMCRSIYIYMYVCI